MYDKLRLKEDDVMVIKKIEKLKSGKYKIHFEEEDTLTTYDSVILKQNILYHKRITKEEYKNLLEETHKYEALDKIIKMISRKYRSEKEIREILKEKQVEHLEDVINYLKENRFIDDERFAQSYINDRVLLSKDGPDVIKDYLRKQNISENTIVCMLNQIDQDTWNQKIDYLIKKKLKPTTSPYMQKQKIVMDLIQKGFDKEIILERLSHVSFSSEGIIKDYEKIKMRLSKKYEGSNLDFEIKKRLYQKGYSSYDIDQYLS